MKLVSRGDTTVVDAYLSPILRRYVGQVERGWRAAAIEAARERWTVRATGEGRGAARHGSVHAVERRPDRCPPVPGQGRDPLRPGRRHRRHGRSVATRRASTGSSASTWAARRPTSRTTPASTSGSSTPRSPACGLRAPMMRIHTVAAGGGSICRFDGARFASAPNPPAPIPGPACYRRGGPLTVTDCNVMVGKLDPELFPARVRTRTATQPLDADVVRAKFAALAAEVAAQTGRRTRPRRSPTASSGSPSRTWRMRSSTSRCERGYDVTEYTLCCFGGAGGQHACLVADALGMTRVLLHPLAGVLSAYGMGLADVRALKQQAVETHAVGGGAGRRRDDARGAEAAARAEVAAQGIPAGADRRRRARCTSSTRAPTRRSRRASDTSARRSSSSSSASTGSNTAS